MEDLRAALDYMVFELSALNEPDLNGRIPQFVIADTKEEFDKTSKTRPRYLTLEQKTEFIEKLQPVNGNPMLGILRDKFGQSKHRRLLDVRDSTDWEIHTAGVADREEYKGWFMYPMERGHAIFANPKSITVMLLEKYHALKLLKALAEHVGNVVRASHCFFEGRPFEVRFVPPEGRKEG